jgi:hypothetical protein
MKKKIQKLIGCNTMVKATLFKTEKKYLSAKEDKELDGKILIIDSVFSEEIQNNSGDVKESLCIRFKDVKKVLSLNQTNLTACMAVWGEDTDEWINHKVKFVVINQTFKGEQTKGIQIYPQ